MPKRSRIIKGMQELRREQIEESTLTSESFGATVIQSPVTLQCLPFLLNLPHYRRNYLLCECDIDTDTSGLEGGDICFGDRLETAWISALEGKLSDNIKVVG